MLALAGQEAQMGRHVMRERIRQPAMNDFQKVFVLYCAVLSVYGCGNVGSGPNSIGSSKAQEPAKVATAPTGDQASAQASGGIDSGGNLGAQSGQNTAPDGAVTTTLGDLIVNVRSQTPLAHVFQEAKAAIPERLFLRHYLQIPNGQTVVFEFDYTDGAHSFVVAENGFLSVTINGSEFVAKKGEVIIEPDPVATDAIKVSFEDLVVVPVDESSAAPTAIGSGLVTGPLHRVCIRAKDVVSAEQGELLQDSGATAVPAHDDVWIGHFCTP